MSETQEHELLVQVNHGSLEGAVAVAAAAVARALPETALPVDAHARASPNATQGNAAQMNSDTVAHTVSLYVEAPALAEADVRARMADVVGREPFLAAIE